MKIEQTETGIEISKTDENEDLFESMEELGKELSEKFPILDELSGFVKIDWDKIDWDKINEELDKQ